MWRITNKKCYNHHGQSYWNILYCRWSLQVFWYNYGKYTLKPGKKIKYHHDCVRKLSYQNRSTFKMALSWRQRPLWKTMSLTMSPLEDIILESIKSNDKVTQKEFAFYSKSVSRPSNVKNWKIKWGTKAVAIKAIQK